MHWLLLFTFAILPAQAATLRDACRSFAQGDKDALKKCISHGELFELNAEFVAAVSKYTADPDLRMKVLKSGANAESLRLCAATGWNADHQLSCMRSYPTEELIQSCRKLSQDEEDQLRCVRIGRESSQVESCRAFGRSISARFECLEGDLPAMEANRCARAHRTEQGRLGCLDRYVARRDGGAARVHDARGLASEPGPKP